jgi:hypothetical protein
MRAFLLFFISIAAEGGTFADLDVFKDVCGIKVMTVKDISSQYGVLKVKSEKKIKNDNSGLFDELIEYTNKDIDSTFLNVKETGESLLIKFKIKSRLPFGKIKVGDKVNDVILALGKFDPKQNLKFKTLIKYFSESPSGISSTVSLIISNDVVKEVSCIESVE